MGQSKIKKEFLQTKYADLVNGKLKEFKTWAQVKSPKALQPALSYALDWLSPELLGTGFRLFEVSDFEMRAVIPANRTNLDSQHEIHQGLVTNALLEMSRTFIRRQIPEKFFNVTSSDLQLTKKMKWQKDLHVVLKMSSGQLDDFYIEMQKLKTAEIEIGFRIELGKASSEILKKHDKANLKLQIESVELLA